eukprot:Skav211497  [mRNA]  locus=scaffold2188:760868:762231:+ [translate_table: standard]
MADKSSPFFPTMVRLERAQTAPVISVASGYPQQSPLAATPSPIQVNHWQLVGRNMAHVFQAPFSPGSTWVLSPTSAYLTPMSHAPMSPMASPSPMSPMSPVVVEQWQTVGQRLAMVFQDPNLESAPSTPLASPTNQSNHLPRLR